MNKLLTVCIILLFIGSLSSSTGFHLEKNSIKSLDGKTLYVGGSGPGNYTKIQDAIDDANNGDTVFVFDNSSPYYERLSIDKSINLIGEDKNTTIIDGSGSGDVVTIYSDQVNMSGFKITHAKPDLVHAGVKILSNHNILRDNKISRNEATGILMSHSSYNRIQDNIMRNNAYYNIYLDNGSDYNTFTQNNFITESWSYASDGLWLMHSSHNIIQNNSMPTLRCTVGIVLNQRSNNNQVSDNKIFSDTAGSIGIQISGSDYNNVFNNEIKWYEAQGISLVFSTGNSIHGNTIKLVDGGGISLVAGEYNIIQQNELSSNKIGIRLQVNTRYNHISACNIKNNEFGILVEDSSPHDNIIYHNNFIQNNINANDYYSSNTWYL
jgi:parallel beta-helix repeat protein